MKNEMVFKSAAGRQAILGVYDSVLEGWPVPCQTRRVETRHGQTFLIECGQASAPALMLLHGAGSNAAFWRGEVETLGRTWRVLIPDIPGEAGKSEERRASLSSPAYVEWLEDLFTVEGLEQAAIAGLSLGGWMGMKFAAAHPQKVSRLALLSASGIAPQKNSFLLLAVALMLCGDWGLERMARMVGGGQPMPREVMDYTKLIHRAFNARLEVVPLLSDDELARLSMPVLLWMGEKDVMLDSRKSAARLRALLPHAELEVSQGVGHVLPRMGARIAAFLENR
ncbi:MAG: alpha/beta hydrolase [Chloroflexi bacterium]|nr:alpha/beta hydrolase [Chloroflexota bacterium]